MKKIYIILTSVLLFASCDDELDISNPVSGDADNYVVDESSAQLALEGVYDAIQNANDYAYPYMLTGVYSDEFSHTGSYTTFDEFALNQISVSNGALDTPWYEYYTVILRANLVINGLEDLSDDAIDADVKASMMSEAKGIRAMMYFDLVRLFGGVPVPTDLITDGDYSVMHLARSTEDEVYEYILQDLEDADGNITYTDETHFSNDAVKVLKAKVELTLEDYAAAQTDLEEVIGTYSLVSDYTSLFSSSSNSEAIFRINYNSSDANDIAFFFYPSALGGRREVAPNQTSIDAFEEGDARVGILENTTDLSSVYLNKFTDISTGTDLPYVYRYDDVLLLYAEAVAQQGDYTTAAEYVNMVRERAGLEEVTITDTNFIEVIAQERRVEFYGEGHRWFDAIRLGIVDEVIANKSTSNYNENRQIWPIPLSEINANNEISTSDQNPGY